MSATTMDPQAARAGNATWQTFGAPNATVRSARTNGPIGAPVSEERPEGRSAETTGLPDRLMAATTRAAAP